MIKDYTIVKNLVKDNWGYGDSTELARQLAKKSNSSEEYLKTRISKVLNGKVEDQKLLLEMHFFIKPRLDQLKDIADSHK